jgi:hypothetical protein
MNIFALSIAVLALVGIVVSINLDRRIANKTLGLIVRVVGIIGSLMLLLLLPPDDATLYKAGEYLGVLGFVTFIVWFSYFRKKKDKRSDQKFDSTASAKPDDHVAKLKNLAELRDAGVLTDDEFQKKKSEILDRM